jgi:hypothetical protein
MGPMTALAIDELTVCRRRRPRGSNVALTAIKVVHTLAWFSIESSVVYLLYDGFVGRSDRRTAIAAGVVASESLIFVANRCRCPLTQLAERLGAEHGSVTDIYLPRWFAHNLPAIHVPLIALVGYLHVRARTC